MQNSAQNSIQVAVGIIVDPKGNILLCQRPPHKSYPLKWEFPGGKVEKGETMEEALARELNEELGITIAPPSLLHRETTRYSDGRTYQVEYFRIAAWQGEPVNREFAAIAWTAPSSLPDYDILEGNKEICARLARDGRGEI